MKRNFKKSYFRVFPTTALLENIKISAWSWMWRFSTRFAKSLSLSVENWRSVYRLAADNCSCNIDRVNIEETFYLYFLPRLIGSTINFIHFTLYWHEKGVKKSRTCGLCDMESFRRWGKWLRSCYSLYSDLRGSWLRNMDAQNHYVADRVTERL